MREILPEFALSKPIQQELIQSDTVRVASRTGPPRLTRARAAAALAFASAGVRQQK